MAEYKVVEISYEGTPRNIVCPDPEKPCALTALVNYLILKFNVKIEPTWEEIVPEEDLQNIILQCLDIVCKGKKESMKEELSAIVPELSKMINLDPYVNSIDGFALNEVLVFMSALEIPIVHGCILNEKDSSIAHKLHGSSYRNLVTLDMIPAVEAKSKADKEIRALIKDFLHTKARRQLTSYGISCIRDHMILGKKDVAILYRDGVFEVICLHHGTLHLLQTKTLDNESEGKGSWQILYDVNVEDLFLKSDFRPAIQGNWEQILSLYMAGRAYCKQLPQQKARELIAESERHAAELLEMDEREKLEKQKKLMKKAAGSKKTLIPQGDDTSSSDLTAEPVGPIPKSFAFKEFKKFLETFDCCGRSKIPYFKGEVELMKRRNVFELAIDYQNVLDDFAELAYLIRDSFDSIHQDLKDSLAAYLMSQGIEKELAEQATVKILDKPKGYQSFTEFAEKNRKTLTEYHDLYDMVITKCPSELGRRMGKGFLKCMFDKYETGYCWNGNFKASDMRVSHSGKKFTITAGAHFGLSKEGVEADFKVFCDILFPYYAHEIEETDSSGKKIIKQVLPDYFTQFQEVCRNIPDPANKPEFDKFLRFLASHPAFMSPLATSTLICHLFTVCDSLLGKFEFIFYPLQGHETLINDWVGEVEQLPQPFRKILVHFGKNYYENGYWFLLKYLRNFVEHNLRNTKDHPSVLDISINSLMMAHYLGEHVTTLILYIVMNLDINGQFATAWTHFEKSE